MPWYRLHYIEGSNDSLKKSPAEFVQADSFAEALATRTAWPVMETYDHAMACAWNPGTSLYYQEMWEAWPATDKERGENPKFHAVEA